MAYREGHQRREEIARLLGFPSYRAQRAYAAGSDANKADVAARRERLQSSGQVAGRATPKLRAQRVFAEPDGRHVRSNREPELRAFFRIASDHDGRITSATITVRTDDGPRDVELWERGGISAITAYEGVQLAQSAKRYICAQIEATGAWRYLGFIPTPEDLLLCQLGAEW